MALSNRHGTLRATLAAGLAVALLSTLAADATEAGKTAQPGMTYESLKDLPELYGNWTPVSGLFVTPQLAAGEPVPTGTPSPRAPLPRELKPEVAARAASDLKQLLAGERVDRGYCEPQTFGGSLPMNAGGSLEILFTPGRVTIATELGLVRRLYVRDTPLPGALEESRAGTSIAHWEGKTLVVTTTGISRNARLIGRIAVGAGARVAERISLEDPDTLQIESTLTAPDVLTGPLKTINRYKRARNRVYTEFDTCVPGDRSFDEASKAERFDATPPADLPPPPPG
jgi:hypothetical protein